MAINVISGVSVDSWVEIDSGTEMRVECDPESDCATLFFGARDEFVMTMYRHHLSNLLDAARTAFAELDTARGEAATSQEGRCEHEQAQLVPRQATLGR